MSQVAKKSRAEHPQHCMATFDCSARFRLFMAKHGAEYKSLHHLDETVTVLQFGDGFNKTVVKIQYNDNSTDYVPRSFLVIGKGIRSVQVVGRAVRMGRGSLMGGIAAAIKSGKAFQGR